MGDSRDEKNGLGLRMLDINKYTTLKKIVDVISIICFGYLLLCPIWDAYDPPPPRLPGSGAWDTSTALLAIDGIPAILGFIWLICKLVYAPRGTYPFCDKCFKKNGHFTAFGLLVAFGLGVSWIVLIKFAAFVGRQ